MRMNENFCEAVRDSKNLRALHGLQQPIQKTLAEEARLVCLQSATPSENTVPAPKWRVRWWGDH